MAQAQEKCGQAHRQRLRRRWVDRPRERGRGQITNGWSEEYLYGLRPSGYGGRRMGMRVRLSLRARDGRRLTKPRRRADRARDADPRLSNAGLGTLCQRAQWRMHARSAGVS
eukprot:1491037-Prymnesium_polylepis.1